MQPGVFIGGYGRWVGSIAVGGVGSSQQAAGDFLQAACPGGRMTRAKVLEAKL